MAPRQSQSTYHAVTFLFLVSLVAAASPPRPFHFRFQLDAPNALSSESERVVAALQRGLFSDSLIVPGAPQPFPRPNGAKPDSDLSHITSSILFRGGLREVDGRVEVTLTLINVLGRRVAGPDTVRVERAAIDSVFVAKGQADARILVRR